MENGSEIFDVRGIKRGKPQLEAPGDGNTEAEAPVGGSPELEASGTGATEVGPPEHGVLEKKVDQLKKNQALPADFDFVPQRSEVAQNLFRLVGMGEHDWSTAAQRLRLNALVLLASKDS